MSYFDLSDYLEGLAVLATASMVKYLWDRSRQGQSALDWSKRWWKPIAVLCLLYVIAVLSYQVTHTLITPALVVVASLSTFLLATGWDPPTPPLYSGLWRGTIEAGHRFRSSLYLYQRGRSLTGVSILMAELEPPRQGENQTSPQYLEPTVIMQTVRGKVVRGGIDLRCVEWWFIDQGFYSSIYPTPDLHATLQPDGKQLVGVAYNWEKSPTYLSTFRGDFHVWRSPGTPARETRQRLAEGPR